MSGTSVSTGLLSTDTQVVTGRATLNGVVAIADGTNAATIDVYDGTSAAGVLLARVEVPIGEKEKAYLDFCVRAETGLFLDVTGTGAGAVVHHGAS